MLWSSQVFFLPALLRWDRMAKWCWHAYFSYPRLIFSYQVSQVTLWCYPNSLGSAKTISLAVQTLLSIESSDVFQYGYFPLVLLVALGNIPLIVAVENPVELLAVELTKVLGHSGVFNSYTYPCWASHSLSVLIQGFRPCTSSREGSVSWVSVLVSCYSPIPPFYLFSLRGSSLPHDLISLMNLRKVVGGKKRKEKLLDF